MLYRIVREHLATFLEHTARTYAAPPRYVVDTFEDYLLCGDLSQGFVRLHCDACGHDLLVGFSCKHRGLCPSCGVRRMYNEAAHIVDRVLPSVPLRQWVLSLPWELRSLAVAKPEVLGAVDRIFAEEITRSTQERANLPGSESGLLSFRQIFGGALNVHPHLHDIAVDGVFTKVDDGVRFHETKPPSQDDVALVARRVRNRFVRWLRRHGHIDERAAEERGNEPAEPSALDGCMQLALAGGAFLAQRADAKQPTPPKPNPDAHLDRKERRFSATCNGFNVHCAVVLEADDDKGRERLIRYCARPPFSLDRIEVLRDGCICYATRPSARIAQALQAERRTRAVAAESRKAFAIARAHQECAAVSHIRRAEHDGHAPRHLHEYATTISWRHFGHTTRRKPCARIPQRRYRRSSSST
ncbi:MAG: transposase zinc-binding domain-containing protein [Byssovorax sp.]